MRGRTYLLGFAAGFLTLDVGVRFGGGAGVGVFAAGKGLGARRRIEPNKSPQTGSSSPSGGNGEGGEGGFLFMACPGLDARLPQGWGSKPLRASNNAVPGLRLGSVGLEISRGVGRDDGSEQT
jgi:hypothetical protein